LTDLLDNYGSFLVDQHITEDGDSFLSHLTPDNYLSMVKKSGADSALVYAACCNGNYYYPTKAGIAEGIGNGPVFTA
jgi:hypothetical protein